MASKSSSILVVDDQISWRELLSVVLEEDYRITTAQTFEEARERLSEMHFDLGIFDMRLVNKSSYNIQGMALLKEARKTNPSMKAIILTGYPDPEQKRKVLETYGADGYYEKVPNGKPLDVDHFTQLVRSLLDV